MRLISEDIPEDMLRKIKKMFEKKYYYSEICQIMKSKYNFDINLPKIKKLFKELNLRRRGVKESPLEYILLAIIMELEDSGANLGYKGMWKRQENIS